MNRVRRFFDYEFAGVTDDLGKRDQIVDNPIQAPGKSGVQWPQAASSDALGRGEFHHATVLRTNHDRFKAATIKTGEYHRQDSLGAADRSGVIVEKNLQIKTSDAYDLS